MKHLSLITIVFIAISAISTGANGQNVYRCGSSYSQKPCPNAVVVDVDDARSKAQKTEADAKTRRETAQVKTIEKARQKEESWQLAAEAQLAAAERKKSSQRPKMNTGVLDSTNNSTPKARGEKNSPKKSKKEPTIFVANAPANNAKPAARTDKSK